MGKTRPRRPRGRCTPGRHTIVDCFSNFLVTGARRRVEAASRARQERILTPCKSALLVRAEPRAAIRASANDQKSFLAGVLLANYLLQMTRVPGVQRPPGASPKHEVCRQPQLFAIHG